MANDMEDSFQNHFIRQENFYLLEIIRLVDFIYLINKDEGGVLQ